MAFDIRTAILGLAVGNLVFGLILQLFQFGAERPQRIPFLATGKLLQGVGWLLLYERGVLPDVLSFTLGNIVLIVGTAYDSWAMYRISQRPVSRALQLTSAAGTVVLCILATPLSAAGRVAVTSFIVMIFFALGGRAMLSSPSGNSLLRRYVGWSMWLMVAVISVRGAWATLAPENFTLFASNTIQLITFATLYYLMLTNGFGLLLLAKQSADRQLRESEARFRSYFELPLIGITITSPDKGWLDANAKLCDLLGYTKDELMQMTWAELTHPDDLAADLAQFERVLAGEIEGYDLEKRFIHKDGHAIATHLAMQGVRHPDRSLHYVVALLEDITERKQAEEQLRQLSRAVEQSPASIVITDPTGAISYVNPKFSQLTGYSLAEALGQNPRILKSDHTSPAEYAGLWQTISAGQTWHGEFLNKKKNGELYWELAAISPITDAAGRVMHYLAVKEDITNRKQVEAALRESNAELQTRNEELDAFAHTAAHDLKNPLGVMMGYAELLADDFDAMSTNAIRPALTAIHRNGRKANDIIGSLLLLASVRKQDVQAEPLDMAHIVDEVMLRLADSIQTSEADLHVLDRLSWPGALGYAPWIEEIWVNYLSNALKYGGPQPRIDLGAACQPDGFIRFSVRDYGPGLTPEQQARLFEPFERLGQASVKGHGLGLSVVRRIADKLGGQVGVDSAPDHGSAFYFTLPAA